MKFSEIPFHPTPRVLRQFAAAWLFFFLASGTHQWLARGHQKLGLGLCVLALAVGPFGLIKPLAVRWLFVSWMVLAFPIGWLISQLMLAIAYYGIVTPLALFFRLRGRDLLSRKPDSQRKSFWVPKATPKDVRSYFHQH